MCSKPVDEISISYRLYMNKGNRKRAHIWPCQVRIPTPPDKPAPEWAVTASGVITPHRRADRSTQGTTTTYKIIVHWVNGTSIRTSSHILITDVDVRFVGSRSLLGRQRERCIWGSRALTYMYTVGFTARYASGLINLGMW